MAVTKDAVMAALATVRSPEGAPLPETGKLSDVVVTDGKGFVSITVDAALVQAWEPVRKAAEATVRAVPGVASALVALTGERSAGTPRQPPPAGAPRPRQQQPHQPAPAQGIPGVGAII